MMSNTSVGNATHWVQNITFLHNNSPEREYAVDGTVFRHSNAGKCSRALYYEMMDITKDPVDPAGAWVMSLGTLVHDKWQEWLTDQFPEAEVEVECEIKASNSSGHADAVLGNTVYEFKTINGTGFRYLNGSPRSSALLQGALNAYALDKDRLDVSYVSMEAMSRSAAEKKNRTDLARITESFIYEREEFVPIAEFEIERMCNLLTHVENENTVPEPWIVTDDFGLKRVSEPGKGTLVGGGKTWQCEYCQFRTWCSMDPAS